MLLAIGATLVGVWPSIAGASCRTAIPGTETTTESSCPGGGPLVSWRSRCLGFSVKTETVPAGIEPAAFEEVVQFAFREWTAVTCAGEPVSLEAIDVGPTSCSLEQPDRARGPNLFAFASNSSCAASTEGVHLGCTNVRVERDGAIAGADTILNAAYAGEWFLGGTDEPIPADKFDLRAVVVHEVGHFLGLAHSGEGDPAMKATLAPGVRYAGLSADDGAAICDAYPPTGTRHDGYGGSGASFVAASCSAQPFASLVSRCGEDAEPTPEGSFQGCSVPALPVPDGAAMGAIGLALGLVAARRVSRRPCAADRTPRPR